MDVYWDSDPTGWYELEMDMRQAGIQVLMDGENGFAQGRDPDKIARLESLRYPMDLRVAGIQSQAAIHRWICARQGSNKNCSRSEEFVDGLHKCNRPTRRIQTLKFAKR